ncbi:MAG TPA: hypothetical protein PKM43_17680, partial [Verrucomicrobiota bacterium]|nr:hypothetical protein [Verrucomicrobiota bacterium]
MSDRSGARRNTVQQGFQRRSVLAVEQARRLIEAGEDFLAEASGRGLGRGLVAGGGRFWTVRLDLGF